MPDNEFEERISQLEDLIVGLYDIVATTHQANDQAVDAYHQISERRNHRGIENPFFLTPEGQKREAKRKLEEIQAKMDSIKTPEEPAKGKAKEKAVKSEEKADS